VDPAATLGIEMSARTSVRYERRPLVAQAFRPANGRRLAALKGCATDVVCAAAVFWITIVGAAPVFAAGDRYALVITGASGGDAYARKYDAWRATFLSTLRERFNYPPDRVLVLAETESDGVQNATRENVRRLLTDLRKRVTKDDQLLIVLIGHGASADGPGGEDAKFNLVGPDMTATEWAELLRPIQGRIVFVNTTGASFPFLGKLAGRGRIVLTATDSAAQQFETVFPEYFVKAFDDAAADVDKNGRVSVWEAFTYASAAVRQWFEQKGQLPTERPLLDDTGAGIGREALNPGADGAVASVTYLQPDAAASLPGDTAIGALVKRRAELETALEELKARKPTMTADQYEAELEKVLIEIARVDAQIRSKS
jgi:hypothetical protein